MSSSTDPQPTSFALALIMSALLRRSAQYAPDVVEDVVSSTYTSDFAVTALGVVVLYDICEFPPEAA